MVVLIAIIGLAGIALTMTGCDDPTNPAHTHEWEWVETTAPTCTDAGVETQTCKLDPSHINSTRPIDALGHNWYWKITTAATEETDGLKTETCSVCGEESGETQIIPKGTLHTHELNKTDATAATCETAGNPNYWTCSECGKFFADAGGATELTAEQIVIATTGHTLNRINAVAATCETAGSIEHWKCSVCGKYFDDAIGTNELTSGQIVIDANGHNHSGAWITNPTHHWRICPVDSQQIDYAAHSPANSVCDTCGYDNTPTSEADFVVTNLTQWNNARTAISGGGNGKSYLVHISGNVTIPGVSAATFGTATVSVTIDAIPGGSGVLKLNNDDNGSLLYIGAS